jgi:hypothetical protein
VVRAQAAVAAGGTIRVHSGDRGRRSRFGRDFRHDWMRTQGRGLRLAESRLSRVVLWCSVAGAFAAAAAVLHVGFRSESGRNGAQSSRSQAASQLLREDVRSPGVIEPEALSRVPSIVPKAGVPQARGTFIVTFREPALAAYRGELP